MTNRINTSRILRRLVAGLAAALLATFAAASSARADEPTGTIAGTITNNGIPVPDASIFVSAADGSFGESGMTDWIGRYTVSNLPVAGSPYRVSVEAPGHPKQYAHGKADLESATLFPVTADGVTTVDESLLPTGTIIGRFTDPAGNGVSAWVGAYGSQGVPTGATADGDGNYSISVLPGTYRVGFNYGNTQQYAYGTFSWSQASLFAVAAGETVTVNDVRLETGTIAGRLTNADGTPAAGISVQAEGDTSYGFGATDDSGAYRIEDLVPGAYRVYFRLPSGAQQWAPQALTRTQAQSFDVAGGGTVTLDEQLVPLGSIAGRFTDANGAPFPNVSVMVDSDNVEGNITTTTDAAGTYRIDGVPAADYRVRFYDWQTNLDQYAHGKRSREAADPITVRADQTTTVDDQRLPTGTIRVTAKDSLTGAAVDNFYVQVGEQIVSTTTGAVLLSDIAIGTHTVRGGGDDHFLPGNGPEVTVTAGQQAEVELALQPYGKISTTVVDRATGAPVGDACVYAQKVSTFVVELGCGGQSDSTGAVTLRVRDSGSYNVFVMPERGSPYGGQWVGPTGGTGTQAAATRVTVAPGVTTSLAPVRLDPVGRISGTVTGTSGDPVRHGIVSLVGPSVLLGSDTYHWPVAEDGSYTVDQLGPYRWPLLFAADNHPLQWSGGVGNRLTARLVPVHAGGTTDFDYRMKAGAKLRIGLPDANGAGRVVVRNAVTADPVGVAGNISPDVSIPVIGTQRVKVEITGVPPQWYGGTDFASATPVWIPRSGTVTITFPAN
ncbi:carboxypeptidase-like regulatory domain-containing protein [Plantactinospora sp. B24E8]|uniref:carboxypeptidase-like regulatory domain-containing protein n=1 Tax=Plantactinospora sp. B24E8 TaxID=3153567 RepID=UPI00325C5F3E